MQDHKHKHDFMSSTEAYTDPTITQAITASINPSRIYFGFAVGVGVGCGGVDCDECGVYKVCTECTLHLASGRPAPPLGSRKFTLFSFVFFLSFSTMLVHVQSPSILFLFV
jgi:hypothetical protein